MVASEMFTSNQSSEATNPLGSISILVVDDDATCLFLVAMMLRSWKYEVVTAQHARDALTALRVSGGSIDLVVTDVHMPDMNGFELQKQIDKEFNLPVVFMSVDDQESMILRGLESGGALYIVKPVLLDDLKNLWQHTISRRNKGKVVVQEFNGGNESSQSSNQGIDSALSANQDSPSVKVSKRKNKNRVGSYNYKNKVVWSKALHNKFLEAIRSLGLDRAVPKTILEHMNVRGLTRENVASHLQKYRMFLKRVAELSDKLESSSQRSIIKRTLQSNFASELPPSMSNGIFRLDYGGHVPLIGAPIVNQPSSSKHEAPLPRLWSGQSSLLLNQANSTQPLSQGHNLSLRYDPGHRTRSSLQANTLSGLVTGSSGYTIHQANLLGLRSNSSPQTSSSLQVDTLGAFMSGSSDTNHPANFPQTRSSLQMSTLSGLKSGLSGHTNRHAKLPGLRTDLSPQTNSSLLRNTLKSLLGDPISNTNSFPVYNSMASGVQGNDNTTSNRRMENLGISRLNPNTNQCPNSYLGSSLDGQSRLLRFGGRGDAGAESAEESKGSMSYGNMSSGDNLCQSVSSFAELQSAAIRFSPTSSCIDQQGKSQTLPEWQKTFDNVGATDQNLILTNDNVSSSSPNSFLPPNNEVDGCVTFPNQFTIEAPTQVEDWRGCQNAAVSFCSHPMEDNPQVNEQPPQQQADDEVLIPNLSHWTELDEFFPPFELNGTPSLQDDQEFLEAIFGAE